MERSSYKRRLVRLGGASAMAVGLAAGGFGVASAATSTPSTSGGSSSQSSTAPPQGGPGFRGGPGGPDGPGGPGGPGGHGHGPGGTISALGTNSFTITHEDGTTQTINTTSSTTYQRDGQASSASALAVGEHVSVRPSGPPPAPPSTSSSSSSATPPSSSSPVTAAEVEIMDPSIHGTVQSVNGNAVTVVDDQGFWRTVNLSASTTYTNNGQAATQSAVTQGAKLVAFGSIDSDHVSLDATSVAVNPTRPGPPPAPGTGSSSGAGSSTTQS